MVTGRHSMPLLLPLLAFFAAPFWESVPPEKWQHEDLLSMFNSSPWAQTLTFSTPAGDAPAITVYLATAKPVQMAEAELARRNKRKPSAEDEDASSTGEYRDFLKENQGKVIVLAVAYKNFLAFSDTKESARMESETRLKVGRKKYPLQGHFPPTLGDPYLRLIFSRPVMANEKRIAFELYLPGVSMPYREAEFYFKNLEFQGKPEF